MEQFLPDDWNDIERAFEEDIASDLAQRPIKVPVVPKEAQEVYDSDLHSLKIAVGGVLGVTAVAVIAKSVIKKR